MFRFTIRELVLVTVIVAMGLGWYLNWSEMNKVHSNLRESNAYLSRIKEEAVEWKRSAKEQKLRADFVSGQLHDRQNLHRDCPECGEVVSFPPMDGKPWRPPDGSIWTKRSLIKP